MKGVVYNAAHVYFMSKKIYITESQFKQICESRLKTAINPQKVLVVKKFLDKSFVPASQPLIGEDGYATVRHFVGQIGSDGKVLQNLSDKEAFYLLQDKFFSIYPDEHTRDEFLKLVLVNWFNHKITKDGLMPKMSI